MRSLARLSDTQLVMKFFSYLAIAAAALHIADGANSKTTRSGTTNCSSCIYYANRYVPISNKACISGESIESVPCPKGFACKVTFLQDSKGDIVHASRSCEQSGSFRSPDKEVKVTLNARTTLYCREHGCNNNWKSMAYSLNQASGSATLHCWVGYGRRVDYEKFKLQPCSQKIIGLGSSNISGQTPVCLLAQLTRQIEYKGRVYESAAYMADCAPHASSVYGSNYPMFEYESACLTSNCNSGSAAGRLDVGLMTLAANRASATGHAAMVPGALLAIIASGRLQL